MRLTLSLFLALGFSCLLPLCASAEAEVVDDSENFALLDNDQAAIEQPVAKSAREDNEDDIALAQDNDELTSNVDLLDKLQSMHQQIEELRGQLEIQSHDLKMLQQQQLSFYKDLDERLRQINTPKNNSPITKREQEPPAAFSAPDLPIKVAPAKAAASNPADEQISYLAAYELVKNKKFAEALITMEQFVDRYPQGGYSSNAHYWLGELYLIKKDYPKAIDHFTIVINQFPASNRVATSMLKTGYALAASGKTREAKHYLSQVIKNHPDTPTAELAGAKLKSLNAL